MRKTQLLVAASALMIEPRGVAGSVRAGAPRAVRGGPLAEGGNPTQLLTDLRAAFDDFRGRYDARMESIEAALGDEASRSAAAKLGVGGGGLPIDPEYTGTFANWFRRGEGEEELNAANKLGDRQRIQAAMSVGDNAAGGYLAPTEWDRRVRKAQAVKSPMRRLAQVVSTTVGNYTSLWNDEAWGSGWVGETAARPATTSPGLSQITFGHGEIYANPAVTQTLLDDADFDTEGWLAEELAEEFDQQEGIAFLSGNGANKPYGMLQYIPGGAAETRHPGGTLAIKPSGHATTIPGPDVLVEFVYDLPAPYRQNASWLMNSQTAAALAKMKDADGRFIWSESLISGQPSTLLGRPVEFDEGMPSIGAGNFAIAFGDFRAGYLINDRTGVRVLRDPYTNKPYVHFYTTKRVGGGIQDPKAIRLLKIAAA